MTTRAVAPMMQTKDENLVVSLKSHTVVNDVVQMDRSITELNVVVMAESAVETGNVPCLESVVVETDIVDGRIGPGG